MEAIDPRQFAASTMALLSEKPERYRNFGVYWFFVKALLKRLGYTRDNLYLLGEYEDPGVVAAMPAHQSLQAVLAAATEEYRANASINLNRASVLTPGGEEIVIFDEDAGL